MKKHPGGRPTVMTEAVVNKLEHAFALGCSDVSACLYAGISRTTLDTYQKQNPTFLDRKHLLKESQEFKARQAIDMALSAGDAATARWWLERKRRDEFSTKTELAGTTQTIIKYVTAEDTKNANEHIDQVLDDK